MRWGLVGLLVAVVISALIWYGIGGIVQRQVVAHRITMVDGTGKTRVLIAQDSKDTHRMSRTAGVFIYDSKGYERGGIATMANGRVVLGLDAPHDVSSGSSDRVGMLVDQKGHVMFAVADNQGVPVVLIKSYDKGGTLQVLQASPDHKQIQVRTLGVQGDTQSTEAWN